MNTLIKPFIFAICLFASGSLLAQNAQKERQAEEAKRQAEATLQQAELQAKRAQAEAQEAQRLAQRQAEEMRRKMEYDRQQVENGFNPPKPPAKAVFGGGDGFALATGRETARSLIVGGQLDASASAMLEEDLNVMSRILDKTVAREFGRKGGSAMGIYVSSWPGGRQQQSMYLDGYGVLFELGVNFPLLPPVSKGEGATDKTEDSVWEQTRREIYSGRDGMQVREFSFSGSGFGSSEPYDAQKVDDLKQELIEALKNAANIRQLKPAEWVTVVVNGTGISGSMSISKIPTRSEGGMSKSGSSSSSSSSGSSSATKSSGDYNSTVIRAKVHATGMGSNDRRGSTLTLRAKKSDVDAFAKGSQPLDEFRKKVQITVR
jgi:hypothetical protein